MGNQSSKKKARLASIERGGSNEPDRTTRYSLSPFRRKGTSEPPHGDGLEVFDVPSKPGKAVVTLTNMQSDKPKGNCITDSIFLGWSPPSTDGGMPILGYNIEMYDLPTGDWVKVTVTEGTRCKSTLDNILCGIMYRFRVRAYNDVGLSVPGTPSDAFVIDTPGVHVAPYFIVCPPAEIVKYVHDTIQFRTKALGTPKPNILWQKDDEPIFVTDGIEVRDEIDGSSLIVHNLQLEDQGHIQCIAVNTIGKAEAKTNLQVLSRPRFTSDRLDNLHFSFRIDEMIQLKFPFLARPIPQVSVKQDDENHMSASCGAINKAVNVINPSVASCRAYLRDNFVIFKVDSATGSHSGSYSLLLENDLGTDFLTFDLYIEQPPDPPGTPQIEEVTEAGELALVWQPPTNGQVDHYIVEYFRDQWQLWLRMKTCISPDTVIKDLIPGSRYKFRVMAACTSGVSEPSQESESVMIGKAAEDELFDLPNTRRPRERKNRMKKQSSLERGSLDRESGKLDLVSQRRQISLDREVYYDANNIRRDVVTYIPIENLEKIGTVAKDYGLSNQDVTKYKDSLSNLASKLSSMSSVTNLGSKTRVDTATKPLQMEIFNQARKSSSLCHLGKASVEHLDTETRDDPFPPVRPPRSKKSGSSASLSYKETFLAVNKVDSSQRLNKDQNHCRQSLTDIHARIGSLQSLLKSASLQSGLDAHNPTFSDKPQFFVPPLPSYTKTEPSSPLTIITKRIENEEEKEKEEINVTTKRSFISQRSDSYSKAIEDDPVSEEITDSKYLETHFPCDSDEDTEHHSENGINAAAELFATAINKSNRSEQIKTVAQIEPIASSFQDPPDNLTTNSSSLTTQQLLDAQLRQNSTSDTISCESLPLDSPQLPQASDSFHLQLTRSASLCSSASSATVIADENTRSVSALSGASSVTVLASEASSGTMLGSGRSSTASLVSNDTMQADTSLNTSQESLL